jgi:hypothetical protein
VIPYPCPETFPFAQAAYELAAGKSQVPAQSETKNRRPTLPPLKLHDSGLAAATLELLILRLMWFV